MSKPDEVTEASIKACIRMSIYGSCPDVSDDIVEKGVVETYEKGGFSKFVGIVGRAERAERQRAVNICNRLGHRQTGAIIAAGKSDV